MIEFSNQVLAIDENLDYFLVELVDLAIALEISKMSPETANIRPIIAKNPSTYAAGGLIIELNPIPLSAKPVMRRMTPTIKFLLSISILCITYSTIQI